MGGEPEPPVLKVDNKSAIDLSKNPVHHDRTKHIDTRFHYIRECVDRRKIILEQITTQDQLADILTKPLDRVKFQHLRDRIGVVNIKDELQD
jgi:transcriptional accessory protein Tex/SPT6